MDNDDIILELLRETRKSVEELTKAVNTLEQKIVGREKCDEFRKEIDTRIKETEIICHDFEINKTLKISDYDKMDSRIRNLEDRARLVDLTWDTVRNNSVLKTGFLSLGVILSGVIFGRGIELIEILGIMPTLFIIAFLILFILIYYMRKEENRRQAIKLMGM